MKLRNLIQVDQSLILFPRAHDFVPADYPAHFVRGLVRDTLDLLAIMDIYNEARAIRPTILDDECPAALRL